MCLREKESPYEGDSERNTSKQTAEEGASLTLSPPHKKAQNPKPKNKMMKKIGMLEK